MSWITIIAVQVIAILVWATIYIWWMSRENEQITVFTSRPTRLSAKMLVWRGFVAIGFAVFFIGDLATVLWPLLRQLVSYLLQAWGLESTQLAIGGTVIVLGLTAYWFKAKNQLAYGLVEIAFAGAAGVVTAKQITTAAQLPGSVATLIGAVYVVSRGASNIADGFEKRRSVAAVSATTAPIAPAANS